MAKLSLVSLSSQGLPIVVVGLRRHYPARLKYIFAFEILYTVPSPFVFYAAATAAFDARNTSKPKQFKAEGNLLKEFALSCVKKKLK